MTSTLTLCSVFQGVTGPEQNNDGEEMPLEFLQRDGPALEKIPHCHVVKRESDHRNHEPSAAPAEHFV